MGNKSVAELKVELFDQTIATAELVEKAMSGIDTALNIAMWSSALSGIIVALVALFGWNYIRSSAENSAKRVAKELIADYTRSKEYHDLVYDAINKDLESRKSIFIQQVIKPEGRNHNDSQVFKTVGGADDG